MATSLPDLFPHIRRRSFCSAQLCKDEDLATAPLPYLPGNTLYGVTLQGVLTLPDDCQRAVESCGGVVE